MQAAKAEAEGDLKRRRRYHAKSVALKDDAMAQWIHGITARPTATDIHSNLGYAYSEAASQARRLRRKAGNVPRQGRVAFDPGREIEADLPAAPQ